MENNNLQGRKGRRTGNALLKAEFVLCIYENVMQITSTCLGWDLSVYCQENLIRLHTLYKVRTGIR